jgi:peroxiredoxin
MALLESDTDLAAGDPAPDFELPGTDGETYTLVDFAESEALLVVFTCNHCPYAQAKFDRLNRLAAAYDEVSVVGINPNDATEYPDDSMERMRSLVADGTIQYDAYLRDEDQRVARAYGAVCTPDPFLFRNEGTAAEPDFRLAYQGRLDDAMDPDTEAERVHVREAIDAILADEPVDLEWQPSRGCSIKWLEG